MAMVTLVHSMETTTATETYRSSTKGRPMFSRRYLLMASVVGSFVMLTSALSNPQLVEGNNNGNFNIGSGNGNCNSGNNNGNGNVGNNKGNGSVAANNQRRKQMKQLRDQLKDFPLGNDFWKLLPECLS